METENKNIIPADRSSEISENSLNISVSDDTDCEYMPVALIDDELSDDESDDEYIYQSNSSRIRQHLEKDGVIEHKQQSKKLNLFQRTANFFYHNKLECIIALIVIVLIAVIGICSIEVSYDYTIAVYTYEADLTREQLDIIADAFRIYGEDIDGDGRITFDIKNYRPYTGGYISKYFAAQKLYDDIYGERTNMLILTDELCRDNIIERFSDFHFESLYNKTKWVSLENTAFCDMNDAEPLPVELGLMMFRPGAYAIDIADVQTRHTHAAEMLACIMEDYPELFSKKSA